MANEKKKHNSSSLQSQIFGVPISKNIFGPLSYYKLEHADFLVKST